MKILDNLNRWFAVRTFQKSREDFYEDLSEAIKGKDSYTDFITARKVRAAKQKDSLLPLYTLWLKRTAVEGGKLSHILKGSAPDSDIMVIAAMEDKGELDKGLLFLARTVKDQQEMKAAIRSAVMMPCIVTVLMVALMVMLSLAVIPQFVQIAPVERWNAVGQMIYAVSYVVTHFGALLFLAALACVWAFGWSLNNWTGPTRNKFDKKLPYRMYRDYTGAIFLVSLASMLRAGDTLVNSLNMIKRRSPPWQRAHIVKITKNLDRAASYGEAFSTGIFSQNLNNRLIDYCRRSSEIDVIIGRLGLEGIAKVRSEINGSAKLLNGILTGVLGCALAFMFVGIIWTSFGLSASIKADVSSQMRASK